MHNLLCIRPVSLVQYKQTDPDGEIDSGGSGRVDEDCERLSTFSFAALGLKFMKRGSADQLCPTQVQLELK